MTDALPETSGAPRAGADAPVVTDPAARESPAPPAPSPRTGSSHVERFRRFAHRVSNAVGSPAAFAIALLLIVLWVAMGPWMNYSTTWQLIVNTGTTIATFLMVFLIQNTQNRDARAIHLKLDELIRGVKGARNNVIDLEHTTDEELVQLEQEFKRLHARAVEAQKRRSEAKERQRDARS